MNTLKNSVRRIRQFLQPHQVSRHSRRRGRGLPPPRFIDCMELEDRTLLSATPLGVETLVNTATPNSQQSFAESPQAVATDANGNYVVAWSSQSQDGDGWGIYAQLFDSSGAAVGAEFRVNSTVAQDQQYAAVAMHPNGKFIIAWTTDASGDAGVRAQQYNASGTPQGGEIQVNSYTLNDQQWPSIAMDDTGNFVITWTSINQDGSGYGIYAQKFNSSGMGQGEFQVNTTTAGDQMHSQVAMNADGDFVITWESDAQDGSGLGIYAQRYNSSGVAQLGEFRVNTSTANDQRWSSVGMDDAGNFVVTWTTDTGSSLGVRAQRYDSAGAALGGEIQVNDTTAGDQQHSRIAIAADGEFTISWSSFDQDAAGTWGVYAKKFTASGAVAEAEFRVNTTTAGNQYYSSVALTAADDAIFVWSGNGLGDADGVFMQRYHFNDAPVVTTTGSALAYTENAGAVAVDGGITTTDANNANLAGATITISANYVNGEDTLSFTNQNGITGSWNAATGTLTLSGSSSVANYQAALRSITYTNTSDNPSTATRTISFVVNDGTANSSPATRDIAITAVNDAPVLAGIEGGALAYTENGSSLITSSITVSDLDNAVFSSATVQITGNYTNSQDLLTFTDTASITGTWDATTGTLTLSGVDTLANYQAALRSIGYTNTSDNPNTAPRTVTFRVNDGAANSNTQSRNIVITVVNDGPANVIPGPQNTNEDTPLVFSAGNGSQISISDVDAGANPVQVTLTATNGTISLSQNIGLSFTIGDGSADASMTFTGIVADINAALNGLSFTPSTNFNGAASLQITTNDQGNTGGGALSDSDTINITVGSVNDAPINTIPLAQNVDEDTPLVFSIGNGNAISVSDVDALGNLIEVNLTAGNGAVTLSRTTGLSFSSGDGAADAAMTFAGTIANINAALNGLRFMPSTDFNGAASLQITTNDQGNTGGGPLSDADTITINVRAINDAPSISAPASQAHQGQAVIFSSAQGNAIVLDDIDANGTILELTLAATDGTVTLGGNAGIAFIQGTGAGDATMVIRGTLDDLNRALDGLSFQPSASTTQLSVALNDLGNIGGGALSASQNIDITQALPPPPPSSPPANGEGGSGTNNATQQPESGNARVVTPIMAVPPPKPAEATELDRIPSARSGPNPSAVTVLATIATTPGRTFRVTTADIESADYRSMLQGDTARAKTGFADSSPLLADFGQDAILWNELRQVTESLESVFTTRWTYGAIAGLGALSAGYVLWALQAGSLVTSALSSLPVWGSFDPLPVLEFWERETKRKRRERLVEEDPLLQSEPETAPA